MSNSTVRLGAIAKLAEMTELEIRDRLIAATRDRTQDLDLGRAFPASQALPTYMVRLQSWRDGLLPTICGLPAFVAALEAAGDELVIIPVHQEPEHRFVLLLSADAGRLLGAAEIARGPEPIAER
jgi:hypothetical protein